MTIEDINARVLELVGNLGNRRQLNQLITDLLWQIHELSHDRFEFNQTLRRMMDRLDAEHRNNNLPLVDKRVGSVIYDTLAPASAEINNIDIAIQIERDQSRLSTATGANLDTKWGFDNSLPRYEATAALRIAHTYNRQGNLMDFPIGTEFIEPPTVDNELVYVLESTQNGVALLRAFLRERDPSTGERLVSGSRGHSYFGMVIPIQATNNLARCEIVGTRTPGQDKELDDAYRARLIRHLRRVSFGGNVAQYQQVLESIPGVGRIMVFPVWRGEGTVKVSIVDSTNMPVTAEFLNEIRELVDPVANSGAGSGVI